MLFKEEEWTKSTKPYSLILTKYKYTFVSKSTKHLKEQMLLQYYKTGK